MGNSSRLVDPKQEKDMILLFIVEKDMILLFVVEKDMILLC